LSRCIKPCPQRKEVGWPGRCSEPTLFASVPGQATPPWQAVRKPTRMRLPKILSRVFYGSSGKMNRAVSPGDTRPEFMVFLELLPPYNLDDVHKAYKARARALHPDRGGAPADFLKLQESYEEAQQYVKFQEGRRHWLATQVEPYLHQQEIVAEVERRGGRAEIEGLGWMQRSFGDFAALAERLRGIRLRDSADGDEFLKYLADNAARLRYLRYLDLAGSSVSDAGLACLANLRELARINLAGTRVTGEGLKRLTGLPQLEWINVAGVSLGWWTRWQLRRRLPGVELANEE
jgi:hypothetical protein